jgi:hypothetical protein
MKHVKQLGLAVVGAFVLCAFLGATASAAGTELCKEER